MLPLAGPFEVMNTWTVVIPALPSLAKKSCCAAWAASGRRNSRAAIDRRTGEPSVAISLTQAQSSCSSAALFHDGHGLPLEILAAGRPSRVEPSVFAPVDSDR